MVLTRVVSMLVLVGLVACGGRASEPASGPGSGSGSSIAPRAPKVAPPGLDLVLSNGRQGAPAVDRTTLAAATPLDAAATDAMFARAKPIVNDDADRKAFAFRGTSQPPPRTGQTITSTFPPPPSALLPPGKTPAELTVVRYQPEGKIPIAPALSVTFSQPMVALTSQDAAATVTPVTLSPATKGTWRWIGTRTIVFDPAVRFPQATTYTVEIPAGTRSATGGVLKAATKFTFETPAPQVIATVPYDKDRQPHRLDTPIFVVFDQKIDPAAVIAKLRVTARDKPVAIRALTTAELATPEVARLVETAKAQEQDGRWVAVRAVQELPADAAITVEIPAGTPSAEGPNTTTVAKTVGFRTYPPFAFVKAYCGYEVLRCEPGALLTLELNNPIDAAAFALSQVTITPAIPSSSIVANGSVVTISGESAPNTTYKVVVSRTLRDAFGQTLAKDAEAELVFGPAVPTFVGPAGHVVLDPAAKAPALEFFSTNYPELAVRLYRVTPADYDAYRFYRDNQWNEDKPPKLPGKKMFDATIKTAYVADQLVATSVDLKPALGPSGFGHVIAVVEPTPFAGTHPPQLIAWVQSTRLAVDAHVDANHLTAFATELESGKPAGDVRVELRPWGITATTDATGVATLPLAFGARGAQYLTARRGEDVAMLLEDERIDWQKRREATALAWFVTDDRKMYKPGEVVSLKGFVRAIQPGPTGDVAASGLTGVRFTVRDAQGNQIYAGNTAITAGGFDATFTLPKTPNLGPATILFTLPGRDDEHFHTFEIQEFRRPEFAVSAQASPGPFVLGDSGDITVDAKYYAGGPLAGAATSWKVEANPGSFTPPDRGEFTFGTWVSWWGNGQYGRARRYGRMRGYRGTSIPSGFGGTQQSWKHVDKTDGAGAHTLHLDFRSMNPPRPMTVSATASVTDVNRQAWSASASLLVHPSLLYVGLKAKTTFVERGEPFAVDVIGVDLDGKAQLGAKIEVAAVRVVTKRVKGKPTPTIEELDRQVCAVVAAKDPAPCSFATKEGGTYKIVATIVDTKGRPNTTTLTFWVSGPQVVEPSTDVARQIVELIPDKREYTAGNTAEVLLRAPFYPAEAIVSWRRSGMLKLERIAIDGPTKVLTVPITEAMVPNLYLQVDLVGMTARTDSNGDPDPALPKRPAYAVGMLDLAVPPKQRALKVSVTPSAAKVGPGARASLALEVRDAAGQPVPGAEVAVFVVDEAILALTGHTFADPLDAFYLERDPGVDSAYLREYVRLAAPPKKPKPITAQLDLPDPLPDGAFASLTATGDFSSGFDDSQIYGGLLGNEAGEMNGGFGFGRSGFGPGGGGTGWGTIGTGRYGTIGHGAGTGVGYGVGGGKGGFQPAELKQLAGQKARAPGPRPAPAIAVRSNFNPLALFAASTKTAANGTAAVDIAMPDNLTRYRIVALAAAGTRQFGKGESTITARLPMMVRPSAPRFLNFGDTFKLPVVVQNQTDAAMTVKLAIRTTNLALTGGGGRTLTVPPNERVEVRFPAAAQAAGTARFQIVATAMVGDTEITDAAELALPVWTPATTEAFATYGVIDDGAVAQPVALPGQVVPQFGGLEITTASTNLQALTDALLYIVHYPHECSEQRSSRIMAIAALRDVLAAFAVTAMPSRAALERSMAIDLERLTQMQASDGGFGFWSREQTWPYLTAYVTHALVMARKKGFAIPGGMIERAKPYLANIEGHFDADYSVTVRRSISAYALYVRAQLGDIDVAKARALITQAGGADKLELETAGWLLATLAGRPAAAAERAAIVRHAMNKVSETAGAANFATDYADGGYLILASDERVDAVMLDALIAEQPSHDLIPKLVTGLLAHRTAGRWSSTQENSFVLLALDRYFATYEKTTPDFVARVWLGADYAGDHAFRGRSTTDYKLAIPMTVVATHDKTDLTIQKDGKGRLYYRVGMSYAPAALKVEAADRGFVVTRSYEAVDAPADVTRDPSGTWHIKAGARVRVKLAMVAENRRYHVALVDPMPAGFEALNAALAITGPVPITDDTAPQPRGRRSWRATWYDHENMRDERVEAFTTYLDSGVHAYVYIARATTPGNFVVPPTKAEEMYAPETFGRGASDRVIVE